MLIPVSELENQSTGVKAPLNSLHHCGKGLSGRTHTRYSCLKCAEAVLSPLPRWPALTAFCLLNSSTLASWMMDLLPDGICRRSWLFLRGVLVKICRFGCILSLNDGSLTKIKKSWENELGICFEEEWWLGALQRIRSSTICARLSLIQFKVFHRVHFSKTRLSEIFPNTDDRCDRCHAPSCNVSHMFFMCPLLQNYWINYFTIMSKVSGKYKPIPWCCHFWGSKDLVQI